MNHDAHPFLFLLTVVSTGIGFTCVLRNSWDAFCARTPDVLTAIGLVILTAFIIALFIAAFFIA